MVRRVQPAPAEWPVDAGILGRRHPGADLDVARRRSRTSVATDTARRPVDALYRRRDLQWRGWRTDRCPAVPGQSGEDCCRGAYYGRYVRSGHLLYIQGDTLFAAPFDVERLETSGAPVAVVQGVRTLTESASSWFDVSENGTLVYVPGALTDNDAPMVWLNRDGALKRLRAMPADWRNPQFSPDGQRLAFAVEERGQSDVWVHELESGREWNLTLDPAQDTSPIWSPDGSTIAFASSRGDGQTLNLYWQAADGTGGAQRLTEPRRTAADLVASERQISRLPR